MKTNTRFQRPKRKVLVGALASAIMMLSASSVVYAQTADATLRGKAPASGDVTAKNIATGAVRRTKAAEDGSYTLVGLPPGTYQVDAGPGTEKTVTITVASTATLDLAVASGAPAANLEGISVNASTLREVKTSEIGATISLHQIQTIPQVSRNFLEFADTVPGMVFNVDASGHTSLRGGAQNDSSVNVYIDGVGQKSYVKEGGVGGQFASQGNPFPQLAIGEYKVITSNYKAEYDQISSAAVTAETKSGTNEFHGEVFGTYTDDNYRNKTPAEQAAGEETQSQEKEYGFAIGGPIIKDTMHFFFTYEAKKFDTPITVTPGVALPGIIGLLPANVQSQFGPSGLPFTEDLYFGKIDWEFSDRDRIEVSSKVRKEDERDNIGVGQALSSSIDTINNDTRVDARWQHSADNWFNEVLFTYEKSFNAPTAAILGNGAVYTYFLNNNANIIQTGAASPLSTQNKGQRGPGIQDDLTFNNLNWYGDHTVKIGAKYKEVKLTAQDAEDINPQFYYDVTPFGTLPTPYKAFFTNPVPGGNPIATSNNQQFGAYIQDDWAVNDKLTLNLGVRWDYEKTPSYLNYVTPANVIAALNGPNPDSAAPPGQTYAQALALGGVNVNDYISNGHNRKAIKDEWQPRLGFSYDLNGDEEHVFHGGIGRAYDRNLFDYLQLEETKAALPELTINFPSELHPCDLSPSCVAFDPKYLNGLSNLQSLVSSTNAGQEVDMLNNNLKAPYSDQFSIGMSNKVGDWNTSATIARILSKDGFVFTLGNRYPNGAFWQGGSQPWGNGVPGFGALIIANNGIETRTNELLLSAEKAYTKESGWGATFAYTYSDATQNRSITEHYSFDEETIQQYPFILSNAVAKHRFVATTSVDGPWGFTYGGKLTLATPIPNNDFACFDTVLASGGHCMPIAGVPNGQSIGIGGKIFGYRDIDLQATKDFDLTRGMSLYLRVELLNALNYKNYSDVIIHYVSNGGLTKDPVFYNPIGNITGVPREVKLTMGFRF